MRHPCPPKTARTAGHAVATPPRRRALRSAYRRHAARLRLLDDSPTNQRSRCSRRRPPRWASPRPSSTSPPRPQRLVLTALGHFPCGLLRAADRRESSAADPWPRSARLRAHLLSSLSPGTRGCTRVCTDHALRRARTCPSRENGPAHHHGDPPLYGTPGLAPRANATQSPGPCARPSIAAVLAACSTNPGCPVPRWRNR